jgi:hypothetical protein
LAQANLLVQLQAVEPAFIEDREPVKFQTQQPRANTRPPGLLAKTEQCPSFSTLHVHPDG